MGDRLFTGSFDSTLKVWDASELFAEKSSGDAKKKKKEANMDDEVVEDTPQKLTIENEKNFQSKSHMSADFMEQSETYDEYDHNDYDDHVNRTSYREKEMV